MTAKQSLALRIGLDCVLIAICTTLFSKNVISLMYHEVVGLVLLILFVAHVVFNRKSITTMESCTAGQIASLLTDTSGSSAIIEGAFVTYSNEAKIQIGVSEKIINEYGV